MNSKAVNAESTATTVSRKIGRPKFSARTFTVALNATQVTYLLNEFPGAKSIALAVRSLIDDCAAVK